MSNPAVDIEAMALAADALTSLREVANGFKAQLEADGWSPTAAEQCAAAFVVATIQRSMTAATS